MSNAQRVIDVAQLSHCVVHQAPASTPDQLCLCSVSILLWMSFQQLHIHVYVGALGCTAASSRQTTATNSTPSSALILSHFYYSIVSTSEERSFTKAAKEIVYWIWHADTHSVRWFLIWPYNDWEDVQAWELLVSYLYLLRFEKDLSFWTTKWFGFMKTWNELMCVYLVTKSIL